MSETDDPTARAEYESYLAEQAARVQAEEAAILESAKKELAEKPSDALYQRALTWLNDVLRAAKQFNERMSAFVMKYMEKFEQYTREQPASLSGGTLRDYQFMGYKWLVEKYLMGESVIVGDEMGLGKTIQVIALLAWMFDNAQDYPILIVAPLSTVGNWIDEIHRFAPEIPVLRYRGPAEVRDELREKHVHPEAYTSGDLRREERQREKERAEAASTPPAAGSSSGRKRGSGRRSASKSTAPVEQPATPTASPTAGAAAARPGFSMPVFVTNLETVLRDAELLGRIRWRLVVVDEGHKLKKEEGAIRRALSTFRQRTDGGLSMMKILLTGTPVQNDIMELWSLCNFVMPAIFKDKREFAEVYKFIALGTDVGASFVEEQERTNHIISKLHELLSRYMMRRTKNEVHLSLPPKVESLVYTPLSIEQVRMLKALENGTLVDEIKRMQWKPANAHSTFDPTGSESISLSTNNAQMQMRKICAHPFFVAEPPLEPGTFTDQRIVSSCGKMVVLDKMLRRLRRDGHKVLIFSQFVTILEILADYFEYAGASALGQYRLLHGGIPAEERDAAIREFNNDPDNKIFAFLLATRAGGLGINLAAADTVIFYDSDWNPKSDAQAMDRAHRIGQVRPVVVYRLVTEGASVERRIIKAADAKGSLAKVVLQEGKARIEAVMKNAISAAGATPGASSPHAAEGGAEAELPEDVLADVKAEGTARIGVARESLLRYWLRAGLSDHIIRGGIKDKELNMILDRARALQAGQRVAEMVERAAVEDSLHHAAEVRGTAPAQTPPLPAAPELEEVGADGAPGASVGKRRRSTSTPPRATPTRATRASSASRGTPSHASPDKKARLARGTPARDGSHTNHHAVPPTAHASADVVAAVEKELSEWERMAAGAPYTASKGDGYEFIYHETSRGLMSM